MHLEVDGRQYLQLGWCSLVSLRAIIRPNFVRKQVADLELMEQYVKKLIGYLPGESTPVDVQQIFSCMVSIAD